MYQAGNTVEQVFGGTVIKQGDQTPLGFNFRDENGQLVSLTGANVQVKMASNKGVVVEKQATISDGYTVTFSLGKDDITGAGSMMIEFIVTYSSGLQEKFPSDDWQRIRITPTLEDVEKYGVGYITFEKLTGKFQNQFDEFTGNVDQQIDSQKQRVDNLISSTPQPSEIVDSRLDTKGMIYTTLKERLDTEQNENETEIKFVLGTGALGEKFPRLTSETDDGPRLLRAIGALNDTGKLVLTETTYTLKETLVLPVNVSLEGKGHGPNTTRIQYTGTGFAIKAHSRSSIENIRIDLNFANSGILYGDDFANLSSVPGLGAIDYVSISGIGLNQIGIHLNNASHVSMRKANMGYSSNNGIGLKISANGYNSGVISGYDCVFGRIDANDVGLVIDGSSALDSFTFDTCYFGGKTATVQLGKNATGVVRNANFIGCHYEQRQGSAVEIYNVRGINFIGMSIQGYSTLETAIAFKAGATIRDVNVKGVEANAVLTNIYKNEGAAILEECILKAASITGGTNPTQFNGDFTTGNNVRFDIGKVRIKSLVLDEFYLGSRKNTAGNNAPTTGTWAQGDVCQNTQPTRTKNISHWKCVSSGTSGVWMAHGTGYGTTTERPSLTANDAGYSYMNTETNTRQYWTGSAWV